MFFVLSKILDFFVTPLFWVLLCLGLGLFLKQPKLKKKLLRLSLILVLIFSNPFLISQVLKRWEIPAINAKTITTPYDVGVVMGGSMRYFDWESNRVVYSNSVDRLLQALQLYHDGYIHKILLTGGSGFVNFQEWKESGLIAEVLLKSGVRPEDIILENNSRNTYENAVMSAVILNKGKYGSRFLLITSGSHMRRSMACFEKAGFKMDPFSVDIRSGSGFYTLDKIIQPDAENFVMWDFIIHEWVGMLMYKMMNYI